MREWFKTGGCRGWSLAILLLFYALNQLWWFLVVPLGQAPDEPDHADMVNYFLAEKRLPVLGETRQSRMAMEIRWKTVLATTEKLHIDPDDPRRGAEEEALKAITPAEGWIFDGFLMQAEAGQPPLYYLLPAFALAPARNHLTGPGQWQLLRLWSILCGAVAVWAAWLLGRWLFPGKPDFGGLLLGGWTACLPMAAFVRSVVTNDALFFSLSALVFLFFVRWRHYSHRRAVVMGVLVGLALLTKASALALVPVALMWAFERSAGGSRIRNTLLTAGVMAALFLPYAVAAHVQGAFAYTSFVEKVFERLPEPLTAQEAWTKTWTILAADIPDSFFGRYEWYNLERPMASRVTSAILLLGGVLGMMLPGAGRSRLEELRARLAVARGMIIFLLFLAMAAISGYQNARDVGNTTLQGRFFLIAQVPIGLVLLLGWGRLAAGVALLLRASGRTTIRAATTTQALFLVTLLVLNITDVMVTIPSAYMPANPRPLPWGDDGGFFSHLCINLPEWLKRPGLWRGAWWLWAAAWLALAGGLLATAWQTRRRG